MYREAREGEAGTTAGGSGWATRLSRLEKKEIPPCASVFNFGLRLGALSRFPHCLPHGPHPHLPPTTLGAFACLEPPIPLLVLACWSARYLCYQRLTIPEMAELRQFSSPLRAGSSPEPPCWSTPLPVLMPRRQAQRERAVLRLTII